MTRPDPFAPIGVSGAAPAKRKAWTIVVPVPTDAPAPPAAHFKLGKPTEKWTYPDATGAVLGYVLRFDGADGKQFRPLTLWRGLTGKLEWRWESWPTPRPLYGLQRLAERPSAPVVICEGEKGADAATRLLPGFVAVCSPNGSKSAAKADWSPMRGRAITVWPDADAAGLAYAREAAKCASKAGATSAAIISPPQGVAVGWDAADALAAGWDERQAFGLVQAAAPVAAAPVSAARAPRPRREQRSSDAIAALLQTEGFELWRDSSGTTYATVPTGSHLENLPLRSSAFERWLAGFCYRKSAPPAVPSAQVIDDIRRILDIKAYSEGCTYEPAIRVGRQNDRLYVDRCDEEWSAVEITAQGWQLIHRPPVKFLRSASARALPEPVSGDMVERLRRYINVDSEDDFRLIISWLAAGLRPGLSFPILIVNGIHGTGKSVLCKMLRQLIDPDMALVYSPPTNERDLILAATNTWVISFDNVSEIDADFSDQICRVSTGGGFRTRALHTNRDEAVFWVQRPVLMNGIPALTEVGDFGDRALVVNLAPIPPDCRQTEADIWREFECDWARILGALLDGASRALRDIGTVALDESGRMADFEKWSMAAAPAFGWTADDFQSAYRKNHAAVIDDTFEADAVAVAIYDYVLKHHPEGWEGSPTELLTALDNAVPERTRKARKWPKSAAQLGNRVKRAKPVLEHRGFAIDRRHSGTRSIVIVPPQASAAAQGAS